MTLNGLILRIRNLYIRATSRIRSRKIQDRNFSIVSNNCWGGLVYESYGFEKLSPTAGMFFMADEYLKFVSNLKYYLSCEMTFIPPNESRHKYFYQRDSRFGSYPIARLDDVEIALLHFHSETEAKNKWERRCKRINWNRMLIKMNDQNGCTIEHAIKFLKLPYKNKVFFSVRCDWAEQLSREFGNEFVLLSSRNKDCCGLFDEPFGSSNKININTMINNI